MTAADPFEFAVAIGALLDELGIPYLVGGSVASIVFGEPRFTQDLDLVIDADEKQVRLLAARYRMGGEVSEKQWRDVMGVLRVNRDLDRDYLDRTAEAFGVRDLLERARQDAGN